MDHFVTLLSGCLATVSLGLFEKFYLKREVSRKTLACILFIIFLFACFQTWEAEYEQVLQLQKEVAAKPSATAPIMVNVPPAESRSPEIVVVPSGSPKAPLSTYIHTDAILPVDGKQSLLAGRDIRFDVNFSKHGLEALSDVRNVATLVIADPESEIAVQKQFRDGIKHSLTPPINRRGFATEKEMKAFMLQLNLLC